MEELASSRDRKPVYLNPNRALEMILYRHRQDLKIPDSDLVHCVIFLDEILKVPFGKAEEVLAEVCALMHYAPSVNASVTVFSTTLDPQFIESLKSKSQQNVTMHGLPTLQDFKKLFGSDVTKRMMAACLGGVGCSQSQLCS